MTSFFNMTELTLSDIPSIASNLKTAATKNIKLLYSIIFNDEFDRTSRKKLRTFSSFPESFDLTVKKEAILKCFTLADFICVCNLLCIDCNGTASVLCDRIFSSLSNLVLLKETVSNMITEDDDIELESFPSSPAQNDKICSPQIETVAATTTQFSSFQNDSRYLPSFNDSSYLLLKDLCATMRHFNGTDNYSVRSLFSDVEDNFCLLPSINEQQKIIFVKKLLTGAALKFIQSQRHLLTYEAFKNALINEFGHTISAIDLHKMLQNRKLHHSESILEYFLAMREIASKSDFYLDDQSLMEYCIQGIPDTTSNKIILYGCQNLSEFKEKLKIYEKIYDSNKSSNFRRNKIGNERTAPSTTSVSISPSHTSRLDGRHKKDKLICFNCSELNHVSRNCPNLHLGPKCKICSSFGHKSYSCPTKKAPIKSEVDNKVSIVKFSD